MGSFTDSKGRKLGDLINAEFFVSDFSDVQANNGVTLSQLAIDVRTLDAEKASNAVFQAALANTNLKLTNLDSQIQATNTAVRSYVDTEIAALVNSAPSTLDTLKELSDSLGADANFATTVATNLGQKLGATASVALTGDATASGAFSANAVSLTVTLADTGVVAGSFGTTTKIPSITVDSKGRITDVSEVSVGGVDSVSFAAANDTLSVALSDGRILDADFSSFTTETTAVQSALNAQIVAQNADLANTNARIATVEGELDVQEAKQAADLANTNARVATVEGELDIQEAKQAADLANTNASIASEASRIDQAFTDIQATNTAVRSYVDAEVAALVDSAPATLDTLNELAAALGDDANFATTLSTNLGQKLGSSATVAITGDATASPTAFSANAVSLGLTLASTGTATGQFGSSTQIPVVTVDEKGRVTAITNTSVSSVSDLSYDDTVSTITLSTSDGGSFTAILNNFLDDGASVELTGDATATGNFSANALSMAVTLADTGTATGSFGSASQVPVVGVDSKGRITSISTTSVAGVTGFDYTGANNTFKISTADGGNFTATIDDLEEVSDALDKLANTNAFITTVDGRIGTQEAKQASDLANTNARVATVEGNVTTLDGKVDSNLANTNAYIASVANDLDTQEAKQAGDLANTNARVAATEADITQAFADIQATNTAVREVISTEVANLVDSAPATLDTLNELAAALGDDANFATTLTTNLGQKLGSTASVALTGDATASGTFSANAISLGVTLADSGTQTGVFGSATVVPQITVDSKGRITNVANVAVSGVASFDYTNANNTLSIGTESGLTFTATIEDFELQSDADARLANTNAYIASVAGELDVQEAKQASDLANTNAYIASVAGELDVQEAKQASDLANTNAYIASVASVERASLANTNLAIADAVSDIAQAFTDIQATNTAVRSYVDAEVAALVDSAPETLDTLNELAAALGDDANFVTTLTTNLGQKLGSTATVTLAGDVTGTASFSANAVTVTTTDTNLANTNAYIASVAGELDVQEAKQAADLANTNAYIGTVQTALDVQEAKQESDLANTNASIITLDTKVDSNLANTNTKMLNIESNLLATNTAIRALIPNEIGFTEYVFTATAGQTVFTGNDDNGQSFSYNTGQLSVFLNGVMLVKGVDYIQTNSTTITLDDATQVNDIVTVQAHEVANYVSRTADVAPVIQEGINATDTVVDSFGIGNYRTVKYLVQVTDGTANEYESMEVMVLHNGSTVQMTEYASLKTNSSLATLDADIFGGNVRLLATPTGNNVTIKAVRLAVAV